MSPIVSASYMTIYPSKILVFGEYCIIQGSRALAIPFPIYFGEWILEEQLDNRLVTFLDYIKRRQFKWIDVKKLEKDIQNGLSFKSTILQGYGLGSSGALCAAIYDVYGKETKDLKDLRLLKFRLAELESFFHGSSSGIDPLVCYLKKPIIVERNSQIEVLDQIPQNNSYCFFLLNTGISRTTERLVQHYLDACKNSEFMMKIEHELVQFTDESINALLEEDIHQLFSNFEQISRFQFKHFKKMIPEKYMKLWEEGIDSPYYKLKLCGAGGGGFLLGITNSYSEIVKILPPGTSIKI